MDSAWERDLGAQINVRLCILCVEADGPWYLFFWALGNLGSGTLNFVVRLPSDSRSLMMAKMAMAGFLGCRRRMPSDCGLHVPLLLLFAHPQSRGLGDWGALMHLRALGSLISAFWVDDVSA
jgi:hypothetical protein